MFPNLNSKVLILLASLLAGCASQSPSQLYSNESLSKVYIGDGEKIKIYSMNLEEQGRRYSCLNHEQLYCVSRVGILYTCSCKTPPELQ